MTSARGSERYISSCGTTLHEAASQDNWRVAFRVRGRRVQEQRVLCAASIGLGCRHDPSSGGAFVLERIEVDDGIRALLLKLVEIGAGDCPADRCAVFRSKS